MMLRMGRLVGSASMSTAILVPDDCPAKFDPIKRGKGQSLASLIAGSYPSSIRPPPPGSTCGRNPSPCDER